jgi:hypothetical protein
MHTYRQDLLEMKQKLMEASLFQKQQGDHAENMREKIRQTRALLNAEKSARLMLEEHDGDATNYDAAATIAGSVVCDMPLTTISEKHGSRRVAAMRARSNERALRHVIWAWWGTTMAVTSAKSARMDTFLRRRDYARRRGVYVCVCVCVCVLRRRDSA